MFLLVGVCSPALEPLSAHFIFRGGTECSDRSNTSIHQSQDETRLQNLTLSRELDSLPAGDREHRRNAGRFMGVPDTDLPESSMTSGTSTSLLHPETDSSAVLPFDAWIYPAEPSLSPKAHNCSEAGDTVHTQKLWPLQNRRGRGSDGRQPAGRRGEATRRRGIDTAVRPGHSGADGTDPCVPLRSKVVITIHSSVLMPIDYDIHPWN